MPSLGTAAWWRRCMDLAVPESTPLGLWCRRLESAPHRDFGCPRLTRSHLSQHSWDLAPPGFCCTAWSLQCLDSAPPPGVGAAWTRRCVSQPQRRLNSVPPPQAGFSSALTLRHRQDSAHSLVSAVPWNCNAVSQFFSIWYRYW